MVCTVTDDCKIQVNTIDVVFNVLYQIKQIMNLFQVFLQKY